MRSVLLLAGAAYLVYFAVRKRVRVLAPSADASSMYTHLRASTATVDVCMWLQDMGMASSRAGAHGEAWSPSPSAQAPVLPNWSPLLTL